MNTAIIIDTETTDTDTETLAVIELAWVTTNPFSSSFAEEGFCQRFCPDIDTPIKWGALAVHHILRTELSGCPPSSLAPSRVEESVYWIGHNIDFDWKALGSPKGVKRICTLAMARKLWPELDSHNLSAVTYFTQGANHATRAKLKGAHSALHDVELCRELLRLQIELSGVTSFEELYLFSENARIPTIMTFGKHKGKPVSSVDRGYMNWYRKQADPDPYLLEAFSRAGM